jgi:mannose-6-phosphate isomerase-like protein (cupin superfamily)
MNRYRLTPDACRVRLGAMDHPQAIRPEDYAVYAEEKMGKSTLFSSDRIMVGLNAFEPGQEHKIHAHEGMDKVYHVLEGSGVFVLADRSLPMEAGVMLIAPEGVPHGIRNTGNARLLVLAILAPAP